MHHFHEDWDLDYDSWEALVNSFVAEDRSIAERAPSALRDLLEHSDEEALGAFCDQIGMPWDFAMMGGGTYRRWFEMLLERIEQQLARDPR